MDVSVEHVLCHDFGPLSDRCTVLLGGAVGYNYRPVPILGRGAIIAAEEFASDVCGMASTLGMADLDMGSLREHLVGRLSKLQQPRKSQDSFRWTGRMAGLAAEIQADHLVTCLDKVPNAPCFVCARLAAKVLSERLTSSAFEQLTEAEAANVFADLCALYRGLGIPVPEEAVWAYLFATLKRHKCKNHKPNMCTSSYTKVHRPVSQHTQRGCSCDGH